VVVGSAARRTPLGAGGGGGGGDEQGLCCGCMAEGQKGGSSTRRCADQPRRPSGAHGTVYIRESPEVPAPPKRAWPLLHPLTRLSYACSYG
jgi:hypothetical protein